MAATTFDAAVSSVTDWLRQRPTPVCWLTGPPGAGKTGVVRAVRAAAGRTCTAPLSAASPDRCLHHAFGDRTTAGIGARLAADNPGLVVLDALDTVQDPDDGGRVTDPRLRLLLSAAARGRWPGVSTLVTSRLWPGRDLPADGATVIELVATDPAAGAGPLIGSGSAAVLEVLASSRQASSGWLLGLFAGHPARPPSLATPAAVHAALADALTAGIVDHVEFGASGEWFQMSDVARHRFLPPDRAAAVHEAVAAGLESDAVLWHAELSAGADPALLHDLLERAIEHRLAAGNIHAAVQCYWDRLGNYARLDQLNDSLRGARICRALNAGRPPHEVSPVLRQSPGAFAVINDWGLYAVRAGAAELSAAAAVTTTGLVGDDQQPWHLSNLARHAAEAYLACGRLPEGMFWAERAKEHALAGLRKTEGLPTREGMDAYDLAFYAIMTIAAAGGDAAGPAHVLDEMVASHERAQTVLANYNRQVPFPMPGPTGEVNAEELLDGRPAALVAMLDGRPADAVRILAAQVAGRPDNWPESNKDLAVNLLLLRAKIAAGRHDEARDLIARLRPVADRRDDVPARCELATAAAALLLAAGDAAAALAATDDFLNPAATGDLVLVRNELLTVRAEALRAFGRTAEADATAAEVRDVSAAAPISPASRPRRPKPAAEPHLTGPERRRQLHEAALAVVEDYNARGLPFALYFRKYDILVAHGPMEFGPQLVENVLADAMPPGAHVLTIQAHNDWAEYSGAGHFMDRSAPALYVGDDEWEAVATQLIPFADLIVSECYMLSPGVRFELDLAYRANRWDRTVLLLPPLRSPLAVIDSDPLIQMFPRCVWADSLHTHPLPDASVVRDLIARMAAIAALPDADRALLTDRSTRDAAFPIDLRPIAEDYESTAMLDSVYQDHDDRVRYYGFWRLFRAASILGCLMVDGDDSYETRSRLSGMCVQMSVIMLDNERDGDLVVLVGDLTFGEQCAQSAVALIRDGEGSNYFRKRAEDQLRTVREVRAAVAANPDRFVLRPRYGPFLVRRITAPKS
jgi:hypothetical protein